MSKIPGPTLINYSELNTLANCERQWAYGFLLHHEELGARAGLNRGSLLHKGYEMWLQGKTAFLPASWTDNIAEGGKPGEERTIWLENFDPEIITQVEWLLARFMEHYGSVPPSSWNVIATEEWLTCDLDGFTLVGRTDGAVEIDGNLWLIEAKSYGAKGRLDYVQVDPQLGCYSLLWEEKYGAPPFGILYEGIYTYEWALKKPTQQSLIEARINEHADKGWFAGLTKTQQREWAREAVMRHPGVQEHPASDSFERKFVDLSDEHRASTAEYLAAAVKRRSELWHLRDTIPNVGRHCNWCGFKRECWSDLGGIEEVIEVDDDL